MDYTKGRYITLSETQNKTGTQIVDARDSSTGTPIDLQDLEENVVARLRKSSTDFKYV